MALNTFRDALSNLAGREIADGNIREAIEVHNKHRTKTRELARYRKLDPPAISGIELAEARIAMKNIPVAESIGLLDDIINEVRSRAGRTKRARLMVVGTQFDDSLFRLVEETDAYIVADEIYPEVTDCLSDVIVTEDPLDGIASHYLNEIGMTNLQILNHISMSIRDYRVNGAILYTHIPCDSFIFDAPWLKSHIESLGTPVLCVEEECTPSRAPLLKTRLQAFLDSL